MNSEEVDALIRDHRFLPSSASRLDRDLREWHTFAAEVGHDPDVGDPHIARAWLTELAYCRAARGQGLLSEAALRAALRALDRHLIAHRSTTVAGTEPVKGILRAARLSWSPEPGPLPLSPAVARVAFAQPPPPTPEAVVRARQLLRVAAANRTAVGAARAVARARHGWTVAETAQAAGILREAAKGQAGLGLYRDPASLGPDGLDRASAWLHPAGIRHELLLAGVTLGLHLALQASDLTRADLRHVHDDGHRLGLEVDGTVLWAREAREPVLCAGRRMRRLVWLLGDAPDDSPLFPQVTLAGPLPTRTACRTWSTGIEALGEAARLHLRPASMRTGYIVTAAAQGVPLLEIAAGLRVHDIDCVAARLTNLLAHVILAQAPERRIPRP